MADAPATKPVEADPSKAPIQPSTNQVVPDASTAAPTQTDSSANDKDSAGAAQPVEATKEIEAQKPADNATVIKEEKSAEGVKDTKDETPADVSKDKKDEKPTTDGNAAAPAEPVTSTPFDKFKAEINSILKEADYNEVYGLYLSPSNEFHTDLILKKFLRANANDIPKARSQLLDTLKWRKEQQPLKLLEKTFSREKFGKVGYILEVDNVAGDEGKKKVLTFNLYGGVDTKETFGDIDSFMEWRIALMELTVQKLRLNEAKDPIPNFGEGADPYQAYQIHDYNGVSFLRQDPHTKAASRRIVDTFGRYYPETLSKKFFVNVPIMMQWMFGVWKMIVSKETQKKWNVISYGNQLVHELGPKIPKAYGGELGDISEIGETVKLAEKAEPVTQGNAQTPQ